MYRYLAVFALAATVLAQNSPQNPPRNSSQNGDEPVIFRSDVSLVRVDAQVVDRDNRAITGLHARDFVLLEEGKPQPIRSFASENMPVDILLLLDVSGSMRPHVERIASAAQGALRVLADRDRVAIMVFDNSTRVRLPFRTSRDDVSREMENILRSERFNGGTRITAALLDAADYIRRLGRPEARRAIVILTDDQTQDRRDTEAVGRALTQADAVLSFLRAPDAMQRYGGRGRRGGVWQGGGGGVGFPGGGGIGFPGTPPIILGRRGGYGGGGGINGDGSHSAGTAAIAEASGGDTFSVDDASALENTLARLRQRYALYFNLPEGVKPGQERSIQVNLADAASLRYPDAEVHFRRVYMAPGGTRESYGATVITRGPAPADPIGPAGTSGGPADPSGGSSADTPPVRRRRVGVGEDSGPRVNIGEGEP